jgi:hypothetical protein
VDTNSKKEEFENWETRTWRYSEKGNLKSLWMYPVRKCPFALTVKVSMVPLKKS